jgi:nucleoid-associated protein YgaU
VTVRLTLRQYRALAAEQTENPDTGNNGRGSAETVRDTTVYTVVKGDTLWGIARKYYGKGQLAYKLASYNNIKNANLIYPGQRITIPDQSLL